MLKGNEHQFEAIKYIRKVGKTRYPAKACREHAHSDRPFFLTLSFTLPSSKCFLKNLV